MPVDYRIDKENDVVFTTARGVLTADDITAFRRRLNANSDFSPDMKQVIELLGVTEVNVTKSEWRALAKTDPFEPGALRALVGDQDITYGILRMYEMMTDRPGISVHVFRGIDEAREWLGIGTPPR